MLYHSILMSNILHSLWVGQEWHAFTASTFTFFAVLSLPHSSFPPYWISNNVFKAIFQLDGKHDCSPQPACLLPACWGNTDCTSLFMLTPAVSYSSYCWDYGILTSKLSAHNLGKQMLHKQYFSHRIFTAPVGISCLWCVSGSHWDHTYF